MFWFVVDNRQFIPTQVLFQCSALGHPCCVCLNATSPEYLSLITHPSNSPLTLVLFYVIFQLLLGLIFFMVVILPDIIILYFYIFGASPSILIYKLSDSKQLVSVLFINIPQHMLYLEHL